MRNGAFILKNTFNLRLTGSIVLKYFHWITLYQIRYSFGFSHEKNWLEKKLESHSENCCYLSWLPILKILYWSGLFMRRAEVPDDPSLNHTEWTVDP